MSKRRYAMIGNVSGEPISYGGLILVHNSRPELEFLFPGAKVVELGPMVPEHDTMSIKQHPDLRAIRWPLRREDFP